jgi:murein L,D-transpeptidase YafK
MIAALLAVALASNPPVCFERGTSIVVRTDEHELYLCEQGKLVETYGVALGKGGVNKRRRGDNKTPLGTYALGAPRKSTKFGLFIPVAYPTAEQRGKGFTGGDIGVHGPPIAVV